MIFYFIGVLVMGIFIGKWLGDYQIIKAAKRNEVVVIDGLLYSVKRWEG